MQHQKIIAFGDSFTNGLCLPDQDGLTHPINDPESSSFAYPAVLGLLLSRPSVNLARAGYSNKNIVRSILEFDQYEKLDIAIITWSDPTRSTIYGDNPEEDPRIHANLRVTKGHSQFYRLHTLFDLEYSDAVQRLAAQNFLQSRVKHVIHTTMGPLLPDYPWFDYQPVANFGSIMTDYAVDNAHPGLNSHRDFAQVLKKHIEWLESTSSDQQNDNNFINISPIQDV